MSHRVYLADRPQHFDVAEGETLLAAGLRHGFALPFGCQSGGCGSCRVRLVSGAIDYPFPPPALSQAERDAGYILMCLARATSDLTIALHQPPQIDSLRPRQLPVRAAKKEWLAHDVLGLTLKLPKGDGFQYLPGQYIDLLLDDGRRRSFSVANRPNGETLELHVRVTPNGRFANWAANEMPERAILRLEGPLGAFYLREDSSRPIVMVAGGTGIAPIHAMLDELLSGGLPRSVHLFWGVRGERDLYLDARLRGWAAAHPQFRYTPVLSDADAAWRGARGLVHEAVLAAYPVLSGHEAYLSGPPVMVRAGKEAFVRAGLDADHLYYDSFDYAFETWPQLG
ncbi:2Fe-2S iron-sulfur cluster-binding protein [Solimonas variicoloris]|uniref:2Fe-2S iron-sulfur cluster-binding protein n=1 Tax=Solimonas variicoloris TaxID=254408 RepID=UPI00035F4F82|nr:2Fe-2S iron-sulfur cluster-binding protein [Solimonas variicoloris]